MCCQWFINGFVRLLLTIIAKAFFRDIDHFGESNIPDEGPCILVCAPHANQFLDPLVVSLGLKRNVSFLAAKKSVDRTYVGAVIKAMNSIPVRRPQDEKKPAQGRVTIKQADDAAEDSKEQGPSGKTAVFKVVGEETAFTTDFGGGESIYINRLKRVFRVANVVSDTELVLKPDQGVEDLSGGDLATPSTIRREPRISQSEVFDEVFNRLHRGDCVGIFPEGGSHDRTNMLPLKAGVTIMALGAMAKYKEQGLKVKLIPCGLNYFHASRFRSRVCVYFGEAIECEPDLVNLYASGKAGKRQACGKLLDRIQAALESVMVTTEDRETLRLMQLARRLYSPESRLPPGVKVQVTRRFALGYRKFQDQPKVRAVLEGIRDYRRELEAQSLKDHQIARMSPKQKNFRGPCNALPLFLWRILKLVLMTSLALPGTILYGPVGLVASRISAKKAKEAVAGSSVKIKGKDVLATWKVFVAIALVPALTLVYCVVTAAVLLLLLDVDTLWVIVLPVAGLVLFPFMGYSMVRFTETAFAIVWSLRPLFWAVCPCCAGGVKSLHERRKQLGQDITRVVEEFGPQMFGKRWSEMRLIPKQALYDYHSITMPPSASEVPLEEVEDSKADQ